MSQGALDVAMQDRAQPSKICADLSARHSKSSNVCSTGDLKLTTAYANWPQYKQIGTMV